MNSNSDEEVRVTDVDLLAKAEETYEASELIHKG